MPRSKPRAAVRPAVMAVLEQVAVRRPGRPRESPTALLAAGAPADVDQRSGQFVPDRAAGHAALVQRVAAAGGADAGAGALLDEHVLHHAVAGVAQFHGRRRLASSTTRSPAIRTWAQPSSSTAGASPSPRRRSRVGPVVGNLAGVAYGGFSATMCRKSRGVPDGAPRSAGGRCPAAAPAGRPAACGPGRRPRWPTALRGCRGPARPGRPAPGTRPRARAAGSAPPRSSAGRRAAGRTGPARFPCT